MSDTMWSHLEKFLFDSKQFYFVKINNFFSLPPEIVYDNKITAQIYFRFSVKYLKSVTVT